MDRRHVKAATRSRAATTPMIMPVRALIDRCRDLGLSVGGGVGVSDVEEATELTSAVERNSQTIPDKKSPQIVGLKPPMCLQII